MTRASRENLKGWGVLTPIFLYFTLFTVVPVVIMLVMSFTNYGEEIRAGQFAVSFVGFKNYIDIFRYSEYLMSFVYTIIVAVGVVAVGMFCGFFIAVFLKSIHHLRALFRVVWYVPALLSAAVMSQFVNTLIEFEGVVNRIIELFGGTAIQFSNSVFWMYFWIIAIVSWQGIGGTALLFLAGLNSISNDVYEAASIDGVNGAQKLWFITLPLLKPMTGFILITGFMGAFNIFEPVMLVSHGGPDNSTKVILYRLYDEAFINSKYGFTCALSFITMILIMILTLVNLKISDSDIYKMGGKKNA